MKEYIVHAPPDNKLAVEEFTTFYGEPMTELIRCKDCKYWGANGYRYGCINATPIMMENDYCSNAERKEE